MSTLRDRLAGLIGSRAVVRNVQWLFLEKALRIVFAVVVGAWVARHLGPERFGVLSYVIAFVAIFQEVCQLGLDAIVVRDLAQRPQQTSAILGTALRLRLAASIAGLALALLLVQGLRPGDTESLVLTALVASGLLFQVANTVDLWFQSQLQSRRSVVAKTLAFTAANGARVVAILVGADLAVFAALALAEAAAVALAMALMYRRFRTQSRWVWQGDIAIALLRESWPLLISGLAVLLYMRLDQIMLRELVGEHELGLYSAAQQLSTAGYFLPMIVCTSVAPELARLHASAPREYLAALRRLFSVCWALSLSVAAVVVLGADHFVHLLYGPEFAEAATVLRWHVLAIVPVSLGIAQSLWIAHEKRPVLALVRTLMGFGVSIALNVALIPGLGATGSAIAYLSCQVVAAVLSNVLLAPHILRLQLSSLLPIRRFE
jgi:O-antigen/teichoic acid export membrane protein